MAGLDVLLSVMAVVVAVPVVVVLIECISALAPQQQGHAEPRPDNSSVAVLIPAHNEAAIIETTLQSIAAQLRQSDQIVVVADNCTDNTGPLAAKAGATVIERVDPDQHGKGYALDYGLRFLGSDPPDVVIIIDADCHVHPGTIDGLAGHAIATGCPVQSLYLLEPTKTSSPRQTVSLLAFRFKNQVRPLGLSRLHMPCLLMGTGMAFPWRVISTVTLGTANIVEDMQLGLDLAVAGHPPKLYPDAKVTGQLPALAAIEFKQRTRWEHGHLRTIIGQVPRLMKQAFRQRRLDLLGLAMELAVPPLSLQVMLMAAATIVTLAFGAASGRWSGAVILGCAWVLLLAAVAAGWAKFARDTIPLTTVLVAPLYVLWKLPLYLRLLFRPERI